MSPCTPSVAVGAITCMEPRVGSAAAAAAAATAACSAAASASGSCAEVEDDDPGMPPQKARDARPKTFLQWFQTCCFCPGAVGSFRPPVDVLLEDGFRDAGLRGQEPEQMLTKPALQKLDVRGRERVKQEFEESPSRGAFDVEAPMVAKPTSEPAPLVALTWWFRLCCFNYSLVGLEMLGNEAQISCVFPGYAWHVESKLLLLQGLLSYLHDSHFQGRSPYAKAADRTCATSLTLCQPLKMAFCAMDGWQILILLWSYSLGLFCLSRSYKTAAAGRMFAYQVWHTLWHILLPLGGFLWIEYTRRLATCEQTPL
eukprot:TRINITY_DN91481_c0_g1_i1.p1 TRINITY_DN91481_c0_g1~~TRINITY_DN91481_c0_g1_i1.p1  ORF type:complete len:313 (+),score=46.38 TRINITY_DN91481_c0_g1_i1:72-1010(+)